MLAPGSDRILVELFQILKDDAVESAVLNMQYAGSRQSSPTPQFKSINSSVLGFLHSPTLTSIHDQWKNHSSVMSNSL